MKLHHFAAAVAVAFAAVGAQAATTPITLTGGTAGFSATPATGSFSDSYTFAMGSAFSLSGLVSTVAFGGHNIDFSSITLTGPSVTYSFAKTGSDPFEIWTGTTGVLPAGSYAMTLLGTATASTASYSGTIATSPVPEPETYALMLAGLGAGLFLSVRRANRV